jgi:hypothetical protein
MENRQAQSDAGERPGPGRITAADRQPIELAALRSRRAEHYDESAVAVLFGDSLDRVLTVQVKGACRRSDKAFGTLQHHLGARAAHTGGNRLALHTIALTERDDLLAG